MAKLQTIEFFEGSPDYQFYCPGCDCHHGVWTKQRNSHDAIWEFNGDMDKPTFKPSIKVTFPYGDNKMNVCHSIITDGKINYCDDCTHELAGKVVEMEDV